jgi:hypothetical protein
MPFAAVPLWQVLQAMLTLLCTKAQLDVVWQVSQDALVATWAVPLPVAVLPL